MTPLFSPASPGSEWDPGGHRAGVPLPDSLVQQCQTPFPGVISFPSSNDEHKRKNSINRINQREAIS